VPKEAAMATNIRIIHARDFIRLTPEGQLDLEKSKKLLKEIVSASSSLVDYHIILDTRKAEVEISVSELWYLAAEISKFPKVFSRKTAILCPIEGFDQAKFLALCAKK
jgi:hypothetical protein